MHESTKYNIQYTILIFQTKIIYNLYIYNIYYGKIKIFQTNIIRLRNPLVTIIKFTITTTSTQRIGLKTDQPKNY